MPKPSNDISESDLAEMARLTPYPELLYELVDLSRETFGWFTKHDLRCIEYPWLINRMKGTAGSYLDIGAGVSPVPLYLSQIGNDVTTVDYSQKIVTEENLRESNEWGYFDYSAISKKIMSMNKDCSELDIQNKFNVIYSISVIEHMPAEKRRNMISVMNRIAADRCDVFLTVDLYAQSFDLWNRDRGQEVEPRAIHGTLPDLQDELSSAGFETIYLEVFRRGVPGSAGDLGLLHARC